MIVHLRPAPLVARVMTGTVVLHRDPRAWLTREIDVGRFLADLGADVVAPATAVDPGPHRCGSLWISIWDYVEVGAEPLGGETVGRSLRALHGALREYRGALPSRSEVLAEIDWLLAALPPDPELAAQRDRLADAIRAPEEDAQPIHGDASLSNLLATPAGPRWNDLEDVCCGSVAWDVAGVLDDAGSRGGDTFAAAVARGYGRDLDPERVDRITEVQALYGTLWRRYRRGAATPAAGTATDPE